MDGINYNLLIGKQVYYNNLTSSGAHYLKNSNLLFQWRPVCLCREGEHQDEDQAGEAGGEGVICRHHW